MKTTFELDSFELDLKGLNELMKSAAVTKIQEECGQIVKNAAEQMSGEKYETETVMGHYINFVNIYPADTSAKLENHRNNTALKALSQSGLDMTPKKKY